MKKQELINIGKKNGLKTKDINDIILKITGLTKIQLFLKNEIEEKYINKIQQQYSQKLNGIPIEYITNNAEFYGLDFFVDNRVLIPRNDTELMVEQVLASLQKNTTLIDIGTGSGSIPISILKNSNKIEKCYATEISKKALEVSKINVKKHNLENKINLLEGNLLDNFELNTNLLCPNGDINLKNLIITANLPYIKDNNISNMDKEVILFEPPVALYGGKGTGFELYEKLINQILIIPPPHTSGTPFNTKRRKKSIKITLFIEIGFDQFEYSKSFLNAKKLKFEYFKDNNGIKRCIKIEF